jgi:hypothetical protein
LAADGTGFQHRDICQNCRLFGHLRHATELDKAASWRGGFSRNPKRLLTATHAVAEKVASTTWRDEPASA